MRTKLSLATLAMVTVLITAPRGWAEEALAPTGEAELQQALDQQRRLLESIETRMRQRDQTGAAPSAAVVAELRQEVAELRQQVAALREGAPPASAAADQAALAELQGQLEELRDDLTVVQEDNEESRNSFFEQLSRRMRVSSLLNVYYELQEQDDGEIDAGWRGHQINILGDVQLLDDIRLFLELEFEDAASAGQGPEFGEVAIEWAVAEFSRWDQLQLRVGFMPVPFNWFNQHHERWRHPFNERPLMNHYVFPGTYTDVGLSLFGALVSTDRFQLVYEVGMYNGLREGAVRMNPQTGATSGTGFRSSRPLFSGDNNDSPAVVGRVAVELVDHLTFGVSGYWGHFGDRGSAAEGESIAMFGTDLMLSFGAFRFRAESIVVWLGEGGQVGTIDDDGDPLTPEVSVTFPYPELMAGVYAEAYLDLWFIPLENTFLSFTEDSHFYLALRFDYGTWRFDQSRLLDSRLNSELDEMAITVGAGYRPSLLTGIRMEFAQGITPDSAVSLGSGLSQVGGLSLRKNWQIIFSFTVGF